VTYALQLEHGLVVTVSAENTGVRRAPFGAGFHPYLSTHGHRLDDVTLKVPARDRLLVDESQVPVGMQAVAGSPHDLRRGHRLRSLRLDDAFAGLTSRSGRTAVQMRTRSGGALVWFDQVFRYTQIFTPDDLAHGVPGVAVEPMTCPADAFNSSAGLIILDPGVRWTGSWGITPI
jgi:aldose 1-epimerase